MQNRIYFLILHLILLWSKETICHGQADGPTPEQVRGMLGPFVKPLSLGVTDQLRDEELTQLGRTLFYDPRLSLHRDKSCNDCHNLGNFGSNGKVHEQLRKEKKLKRDIPSIYNTAHLNLFYWNGRLTDLKEQTASSLLDPWEMAMPDRKAVVDRLKSIDGYTVLFKKAYPKTESPIIFDHVLKALNQFERGLVTSGPIDRFLNGDDSALNEKQLAGAMLFSKYNCGACHTGGTFGGQMLQKLGVLKPWPNQRDTGYYEVTKQPAHKMFFRVQGLRNVEKTGPYFHDSSIRTLKQAIQQMSIHERGRKLGFDEIILIEEFLKSLTGTLPKDYIRPPELP